MQTVWSSLGAGLEISIVCFCSLAVWLEFVAQFFFFFFFLKERGPVVFVRREEINNPS
jgi:hypothetical protein